LREEVPHILNIAEKKCGLRALYPWMAANER
jgi:hypothetical protein